MRPPRFALGPLLLALLALATACSAASLLEEAQRAHCGGAPCPAKGATVAGLALALHGSGAHRRLQYRLSARCAQPPADGPPGAAGEGQPASAAAAEGCPAEVALLQPLPPVLFADVYELDNAATAGRGPRTRLFGKVDVESIERYAAPTVLAVYSSGGGGNASSTAAMAGQHQAPAPCGEAVVEVPLHARYPHPRAPQQQQHQQQWSWLSPALSAAAAAELAQPLVLVRCGGEWQAADATAPAAAVRWGMPAGNLLHGPLVAAGTAGAVGCGVAAVLWALLRPLPAGKAAAAQRRKQQ